MHTHTQASQESLTPADALRLLEEGNRRFLENRRIDRHLLKQVDATREGQWPFAVILSCIDSRTSAELIFDQGLGDVLSVRIAGNFVNEDVLGSMEFGCTVAGAKLVVVLGHTRCGAITAACDGGGRSGSGNLPRLLGKLVPAVKATAEPRDAGRRTGADPHFVRAVAETNVHLSLDAVRARSHVLRRLHDEGTIDIAGGMYDVETGAVTFLDGADAHEGTPRDARATRR